MKPDRRSAALRRRCGALGAAAVVTGAVGYVALVDPHNRSSPYPPCLFRLLTGWNCPACGGLRMLHDLLHADLTAAVTDNLFLLAGLPMLALWTVFRRRRVRPVLPVPVVVTIVTAAVAWTVLRNLPGFPLIPNVFNS